MREPVIFLIEDDEDTRLLFKEILKKNGYNVLPAIDEADALERVSFGHLAVDLVLVDLVRKSTEEMLKTGRRIRRSAKLDVPLVTIAGEYNDELRGKNIQIGENDYVVYLEFGKELFDLLSSLTKGSASEKSRLKNNSSPFAYSDFHRTTE
jgi:two-component system chemotaxis sensor kinase CheA